MLQEILNFFHWFPFWWSTVFLQGHKDLKAPQLSRLQTPEYGSVYSWGTSIRCTVEWGVPVFQARSPQRVGRVAFPTLRKQCKGKAKVLVVGQMSSLSYWNIVNTRFCQPRWQRGLQINFPEVCWLQLHTYDAFLKLLPGSLITCAKELTTAWFVSTRPGKGQPLIGMIAAIA